MPPHSKAIKPPKTFSEQLEILQDKGVVIDGEEKCLDFLRRVNYYRFSAYLAPFLGRDGKTVSPVDFSRISGIYEFDSRLRVLLFQRIEEIEIYLRTQFSYFSAHTHGALGYLDARNFSPIHNKAKFDSLLRHCIDENRHTLVVKHHVENYDGDFPIWVMIEFFSVGMLSYFYADMKEADRKVLARGLYGTTPDKLRSWLRCLTDLRNRCAHYARIYYWIFSALPKFPKEVDFVADHRFMTQLLVLKFLSPDREGWNSFVSDLGLLVDEYSQCISLEHLSFPDDWQAILVER